MQEVNFDEVVEKMCAQDPRFARDAYYFTREALAYTQKLASYGNKGAERHVTGQELLEGIRQFALQEYGPMTVTVFEEWGIRNCHDFGEIVFNLIESGLLKKTENDSRTHFQAGYNFTEAFRRPFWPRNKMAAGKTPW
jgi:uncharacterized repeat protein (TIGR04138 family)